jgi:hypothetical protein
MFSAILPTADIQPRHRQGMSEAYRVADSGVLEIHV